MGKTSGKEPSRVIRLGKYEVISHIATGGMGAVYKAKDTETGEVVALKVLPPGTGNSSTNLERFQREARSAERLEHPNIVRLISISNEKSVWFLAMEFVEGIDLLEYISRKKKLPPKEARRILFQAAHGLHHAHKHGVVHRDIKPSNFLLTQEDGKPIVKMADFGLARVADEDEFRLTREGNTVGTVDYISPEQAKDSGSADIRSDLYSLGCTLFHMLAGRAPFAEGSLTERLYKHIEEEPPKIRDFCPEIPSYLESILYRLLEKDPADRFQEPRELLEAIAGKVESSAPIDAKSALEGLAEEEVQSNKAPRIIPRKSAEKKKVGPRQPTQTQPAAKTDAPAPAKPNRKMLMIGGAVGGLLLVITTILMLNSGSKKPPPQVTHNSDNKAPTDTKTIPPVPTDKPVVSDDKPKTDQDKTKPPVVKDKSKPPDKPKPERLWPWLVPAAKQLSVDAVKEQMDLGWKSIAPPARDAAVIPVSRVGRDLSKAIEAAKKANGNDVILEIQDNGPLFTSGLQLAGKNLTLRAAKGYHPLIVWSPDPTKPAAALLQLSKGALRLHGVDLAFEIPEGMRDRHTSLLTIQEGSLHAEQCTFSVAGKSSVGVTMARLQGKGQRCLFRHCYGRGESPAIVDAESPGLDVRIEDSLFVGGNKPLLRLKVEEKTVTQARLIRSTLIGHGIAVQLVPADSIAVDPVFHWKLWDSILSRPGRDLGGTLLSLSEKCVTTAVKVRAWNCLYAGWQTLFQGQSPLTVGQHTDWKFRWGTEQVDQAVVQTWPRAGFQTLSELPASELRTTRVKGAPVGFAATSHEGTIGCDTDSLPVARDHWQALTIKRFTGPPSSVLLENVAPDIPRINDGRYHGGQFDVSQYDVGAVLKQIASKRALGPKLVLHLYQSNFQRNKFTTPFRVRGSDVVIYLQPVRRPADKEGAEPETERMELVSGSRQGTRQQALIEVENGNLHILGGRLRLPDFASALIPPYLLRVTRGNLRMINTHLQGPRFDPPKSYRGLILFEPAMAKPGTDPYECAMEQCVLLSSRDCLHIKGGEATARVEQSVMVTSGTAIHLEPEEISGNQWKLYCDLQRATLAVGQSLFRLQAAKGLSVPLRPGIIQTRSCALLTPFDTKAVAVQSEGEAVQRGQIIWQSDQDVLDPRLHAVLSHGKAMPKEKQSVNRMADLWGPMARKRPVPELPFRYTFSKEKWDLRKLQLPVPRKPPVDVRNLGADLKQLKIIKATR